MFIIKKLKNFLNKQKSSSEKGQVIVEYVLITVIALTLALIITTRTIKRDPEDPGFIIFQWERILNSIGQDMASE